MALAVFESAATEQTREIEARVAQGSGGAGMNIIRLISIRIKLE
jgi:hypothetical protein